MSREGVLKLVAEEISMPSLFLEKIKNPSFFNFSEVDKLYFFGLEHLLHLGKDGRDSHTNGKKLRAFNVDEVGKHYHNPRFLGILETFDEEDWGDIFDYVLERKLEANRKVYVGISPRQVREAKGYISLTKAIFQENDGLLN